MTQRVCVGPLSGRKKRKISETDDEGHDEDEAKSTGEEEEPIVAGSSAYHS